LGGEVPGSGRCCCVCVVVSWLAAAARPLLVTCSAAAVATAPHQRRPPVCLQAFPAADGLLGSSRSGGGSNGSGDDRPAWRSDARTTYMFTYMDAQVTHCWCAHQVSATMHCCFVVAACGHAARWHTPRHLPSTPKHTHMPCVLLLPHAALASQPGATV
jgi:hypothetical protein